MLQDIFFYLVKKDIFKSHNPLAALYFIANLITSYSINLANMNLISKELSNELENYSKFLIYISDAADNTNDAKNLH